MRSVYTTPPALVAIAICSCSDVRRAWNRRSLTLVRQVLQKNASPGRSLANSKQVGILLRREFGDLRLDRSGDAQYSPATSRPMKAIIIIRAEGASLL